MNIKRISLTGRIGALPCLAADFTDTRTIDRALHETPEALINSQGLAQHDVSLRGSSYTGAGLSAFSPGVGGFLDGEMARKIDYDANDYDRCAGGALLQQGVNDWQIDLICLGASRDQLDAA